MNPSTRTAAALAAAAVALVTAYGTARAASRIVAPAQHRATVAVPGDTHDPKQETGLRED
ncbi:hypothetical protein [Streptomyces sp. NPDC007905]|uniref:hypothetical protein n=1 Tax=Streptomyces sp. NPDC007905 TaxID=3364788 RepID=UPI0036E16E51